jgi:hypothetical protein
LEEIPDKRANVRCQIGKRTVRLELLDLCQTLGTVDHFGFLVTIAVNFQKLSDTIDLAPDAFVFYENA